MEVPNETPEERAVRIDVENRYHAYLKGWRTAARVGAQDPAVAGPLDWDSARALRGWEDP